MIAVVRYLGNAPKREAEHEANARLLAAAFNAFDKAARALGCDAAELAERIDLAALINALRYVATQSPGSDYSIEEAFAFCRTTAREALAPIRGLGRSPYAPGKST